MPNYSSDSVTSISNRVGCAYYITQNKTKENKVNKKFYKVFRRFNGTMASDEKDNIIVHHKVDECTTPGVPMSVFDHEPTIEECNDAIERGYCGCVEVREVKVVGGVCWGTVQRLIPTETINRAYTILKPAGDGCLC